MGLRRKCSSERKSRRWLVVSEEAALRLRFFYKLSAAICRAKGLGSEEHGEYGPHWPVEACHQQVT